MSHPSQVLLPFPRWEPKEKPVKEDDVGPQVTHIYEVTTKALSDFTDRKWIQRRQGWNFRLLPLMLVAVECKEKRRKRRCGKLLIWLQQSGEPFHNYTAKQTVAL